MFMANNCYGVWTSGVIVRVSDTYPYMLLVGGTQFTARTDR